MLPSHNCIIIINVQFSRYIFEFPFKKLNEIPDFSEISVNLLIVNCQLSIVNCQLSIGEVVGQNGLAFLRKSHAGCNSPPDCCQEPAFESILNSLSTASLAFALCPLLHCQKWWAKMDSNHRPHDYQSCALAS